MGKVLVAFFSASGVTKKVAENLAKAASADITIAPQANRLKSQIQEIMSAQAQNAKLQAEYQEYLRKKKAEEDFWNQK